MLVVVDHYKPNTQPRMYRQSLLTPEAFLILELIDDDIERL